jgi:hypothetical protein
MAERRTAPYLSQDCRHWPAWWSSMTNRIRDPDGPCECGSGIRYADCHQGIVDAPKGKKIGVGQRLYAQNWASRRSVRNARRTAARRPDLHDKLAARRNGLSGRPFKSPPGRDNAVFQSRPGLRGLAAPSRQQLRWGRSHRSAARQKAADVPRTRAGSCDAGSRGRLRPSTMPTSTSAWWR